MNLVAQFFVVRRDKLLMKVGCWLVCFSLVLGLMLPQQRAEAVGTLTIAAVASVAAAYLGACGMTFITQGMDKDALVSSVQRLIQEFLDTELGGITIQDWLGSVWNVAVLAGKIIMGRPLTEEFVSFAQWVAQKYGAQTGVNEVYSDQSITFYDGSTYNLSYFLNPHELGGGPAFSSKSYALGTPISFGSSLSDYKEIQLSLGYSLRLYISSSSYHYYNAYVYLNDSYAGRGLSYISDVSPLTFIWAPDVFGEQGLSVAAVYPDGSLYATFTRTAFIPLDMMDITLVNASLSVDRAPSMSYIPEGIEAEQGIALDVGAAATMDLDQVLGGVLDNVIAGELTSTMTATDEKTEPVDPPAGAITDVDNLGLPSLGAALTSRFPFSIPWDFFRAVQLLAAPAKAPYFEVDFMEPLADDVGGWRGDTTVILDFSEYAIIGQISRWTSTIGFCLILAGATKRLIWTA